MLTSLLYRISVYSLNLCAIFFPKVTICPLASFSMSIHTWNILLRLEIFWNAFPIFPCLFPSSVSLQMLRYCFLTALWNSFPHPTPQDLYLSWCWLLFLFKFCCLLGYPLYFLLYWFLAVFFSHWRLTVALISFHSYININ